MIPITHARTPTFRHQKSPVATCRNTKAALLTQTGPSGLMLHESPQSARKKTHDHKKPQQPILSDIRIHWWGVGWHVWRLVLLGVWWSRLYHPHTITAELVKQTPIRKPDEYALPSIVAADVSILVPGDGYPGTFVETKYLTSRAMFLTDTPKNAAAVIAPEAGPALNVAGRQTGSPAPAHPRQSRWRECLSLPRCLPRLPRYPQWSPRAAP